MLPSPDDPNHAGAAGGETAVLRVVQMSTDYRPRFLVALKAQKQAFGRPLRHDEILDVCHLTAEILIGEAVGEAVKLAKAKSPKKTLETDAEWFASLKADPALAGLNIDSEWSRCCLWYRQNVSKVGQPTRKRFTNWLLKAEKVVELKSMGAQHATGLRIPAPDGPDGWLPWLTTELSLLSEDHPAHGQLLFALNNRKFSGLPQSWQARCNSQLRQA